MAKRYQMGNQNPYIEEAQTTQCPKEKAQTAIVLSVLLLLAIVLSVLLLLAIVLSVLLLLKNRQHNGQKKTQTT
jgi:flagellar basal body-associated protein FliL